MIGNDVIDLNFADSPPYEHIRRLHRVCTSQEIATIRSSLHPSTTFAFVWAAKEAAFKLLSSRMNHCGFVPGRFETNFAGTTASRTIARLTVRFATEFADVTIVSNENWVHAVAVAQKNCPARWKVRVIPARAASGETESESAFARLLAAELLSEWGLKDAVLEFHNKVPVVRAPARRLDQIGISLSHHGRYAAAAIALPVSAGAGRILALSDFGEAYSPPECVKEVASFERMANSAGLYRRECALPA